MTKRDPAGPMVVFTRRVIVHRQVPNIGQNKWHRGRRSKVPMLAHGLDNAAPRIVLHNRCDISGKNRDTFLPCIAANLLIAKRIILSNVS
jgi:hypothetical protein